MLIKMSTNIKPVFTDLQNRSDFMCDALTFKTEVRLSDLCSTLYYFITVGGTGAMWVTWAPDFEREEICMELKSYAASTLF